MIHLAHIVLLLLSRAGMQNTQKKLHPIGSRLGVDLKVKRCRKLQNYEVTTSHVNLKEHDRVCLKVAFIFWSTLDTLRSKVNGLWWNEFHVTFEMNTMKAHANTCLKSYESLESMIRCMQKNMRNDEVTC